MKHLSKTDYLLSAFLCSSCVAVIAFAVYAQLQWDMLPCPLCVMQRYAFSLIGLCGLLGLIWAQQQRIWMLASALFSLIGLGLAGYLVYVQSRPATSCGVDPWSEPMNTFFLAKWFPNVYQVNGLCETPYEPILGLSISTWSCMGFVFFTLLSLIQFYRLSKKV